MAFTFRGGVHPKGNKERTEGKEIVPFPPLKEYFLPTVQHIGRPALPIVAVGDLVKKGQLVAEAAEGVSSPVYSPVSGKVTGIVQRRTLFSSGVHIVIENDGKEEEVRLSPLGENPLPEEIRARVREAGIVGMGGAGFPTYAKLGEGIDTLIVNAAECEPYITCDYRVLLERTADFLAGVNLLRAAVNAKRAVIAVENNKPQALTALHLAGIPVVRRKKERKDEGVFALELKTKYPQGGEKQIVYAASGRTVPEGQLPSSVGCLVVNAETALATFEAVVLGKPLYERAMTVSGDGVQNPCNVLVKTGTPYGEIAAFCGVAEETEMVVSGGPMMGFCTAYGDVCTTKTTGSLLFLTKKEFSTEPASACIGCGRCVSGCPMRLMPVMIDRFSLAGNLKEAERYGAPFCMECGCCSFVCPAKRPLLQSIRTAKKKIREEKSRG